MNILHIDGGRAWGGGQNQVRLLMHALRDTGVAQLCLCPAGSPLAERLEAESLPCATVSWKHGPSLRALGAITRLARAADVLHCHDAHSLQLALLPAALLRRPVVAARRMTLPTRAAKWNRADRVVAISGVVRDALLASGVEKTRIRLIHSGIAARELRDLPALQPPLRERLGVLPSAFLAGSIGALVEIKGQRIIAEAAVHAPAVQWALIGEGRTRSALEASIAAHAVGDRVHLAGALPDARRALRELDVFVFTAEREALGTSILDAMACDVPVVAADTEGPGEVLGPVHAETGATLYPPGDAAALAALVENVRQDAALRERMIAAQRRRLVDFDIEHGAAATLALYREVASA